MRLAWLRHPLKWLAALGLIGGALFAAYQINAAMRAEREREAAEEKAAPAAPAAGSVSLDAEAARRYGLKVEPAVPVEWVERVAVYGQVVPNPRAAAEVRVPFAGVLRADGNYWPQLGQQVKAGQTLGWVEVRVQPQERLTLRDNLNTALEKQKGAEEVVRIQQERVQRLEQVAKSQIGSQQQVDDARVLLAEAKAQLATAAASVKLWQGALAAVDSPGAEPSLYRLPVTAPAGGEVTELAARPGEAVAADGRVAQVVDFGRALVRLNVPPELLAAGPAPEVALVPAATGPEPPGLLGVGKPARPPQPVKATLVGPAPQVGAASQFAGYWYEAHSPSAGGGAGFWRPGLQVKAEVARAGARPVPAASVPAGAVLFHEGRAIVYIRRSPTSYQRREVRLLGRDGDRWVVDRADDDDDLTGLAPGQEVVSRGAEVLLSREFLGAAADND